MKKDSIRVEHGVDSVRILLGEEVSRNDLLVLHSLLSEFIEEQHVPVSLDLRFTQHAHYLIGDLILSKSEIARRMGVDFEVLVGKNRWMKNLIEVRVPAVRMAMFRNNMR